MNRGALFFISCLILISFGLIMIYSTSSLLADEKFSRADFFLRRQLIGVGIGLLLLFLAKSIPLDIIEKYSFFIYLMSIVLLIMVFVPYIGVTVGGARRWIRVFNFTFQPTELAKLSVILMVSHWLSKNIKTVQNFKVGVFYPLLIASVPLAFIFIQPDLGNCIVLTSVLFLIIFIAGIKMRYIISLILLSVPAVIWAIFSADYRRMRLFAFMDPWQDPQGSGFQLIQSFIALGSGGISGVGLGQSRQKMYYLPEAHTDFIFSIIGEELGFLGTFFLVFVFMIFVVLGFQIVKNSKTPYSHLLSMGVLSMITIPCIVNIAVVTGSVPTKGIPLPFISYGNSNLIINLIGVGILLNISNMKGQNRKATPKKNVYLVRQ